MNPITSTKVTALLLALFLSAVFSVGTINSTEARDLSVTTEASNKIVEGAKMKAKTVDGGTENYIGDTEKNLNEKAAPVVQPGSNSIIRKPPCIGLHVPWCKPIRPKPGKPIKR